MLALCHKRHLTQELCITNTHPEGTRARATTGHNDDGIEMYAKWRISISTIRKTWGKKKKKKNKRETSKTQLKKLIEPQGGNFLAKPSQVPITGATCHYAYAGYYFVCSDQLGDPGQRVQWGRSLLFSSVLSVHTNGSPATRGRHVAVPLSVV